MGPLGLKLCVCVMHSVAQLLAGFFFKVPLGPDLVGRILFLGTHLGEGNFLGKPWKMGPIFNPLGSGHVFHIPHTATYSKVPVFFKIKSFQPQGASETLMKKGYF